MIKPFRRIVLAGIACLPLLASACGGSSSSSSTPGANLPDVKAPAGCTGSTDAAAILSCAETAIRAQGAYAITMTGHNQTIPQWGGVDSGNFQVGVDPSIRRAELLRTGDGDYTVATIGNETFFKRSTCSEWARIPGGGPDVLKPFDLAAILPTAANPRIEGANLNPTVSADIDGLGRIIFEFDAKTFLPIRAVKQPENGVQFEWIFSDWGKKPSADKPNASYDRGPGGNPC